MSKPFKIVGQEPAFWLALVAGGVMLSTAYGLDLTPEKQAAVNGGATAVMGLLTAMAVARNQILPAVAGVMTGLFELAIQFHPFGWHPSPDQMAATSFAITLVLAAYLRTQVTAPVSADWQRVPRVPIGKAA